MPIIKQFLFKKGGLDVFLFSLTNSNQTEIRITNYGAIITAFIIRRPGKEDTDIVLGFDNVENYWSESYRSRDPFMGAAIGRYANRIKNGEFILNDKKYLLARNMGNDHLHGGVEGFDKKVWSVHQYSEYPHPVVELLYASPDGEENYPGNLEVRIRFMLTKDDELSYEYFAVCDKDTIINLTHHSYFNLGGGNRHIGSHLLKIYSHRVLEQDAGLCSTGKLGDVKGTRFDFTSFKPIGVDLKPGEDFDQGFELDDQSEKIKLAAEVYNKKTDIRMQVLTTEPTVHLYTGNGLDVMHGKNGTHYGPYSGFCLETQKHANGVNIPSFPETVLKKGEPYYTKTAYKIIHS